MNSCLFVSSQLSRWGYSLLVAAALHPRVAIIIIAHTMAITVVIPTKTLAAVRIKGLAVEAVFLTPGGVRKKLI